MCVECVLLDVVFRFRVIICCVFFFQAEDGIRDLVRSRGLGDVYKRQPYGIAVDNISGNLYVVESSAVVRRVTAAGVVTTAVSYTHLTLPTSDLV